MADTGDDETLMAAVARGDQRALRQLMNRHMPRAIRLATRIAGSAADGDDVAQETFVRIWSHAGRFDPRRARFTTWMYQILLNLALDNRRRRTHAPLPEAADVAASGPSSEEALIEDERQRLVSAAIAALPDRQRAAVALFHLEGVSGREGAAILGVSEKGFESLLSRGRAACREFVLSGAAEGDPR